MIYYALIVVMAFLGAVASFFLKKASEKKGLFKMLLDYNIYVGGCMYFVSALVNIYVLRFLDYSIVLPLTSITYVFTMIISRVILKEKISFRKICGVTLIVIGATIISI